MWNHLNRERDHLTQRRTQGAGLVKGWEDKRVGYVRVKFWMECPSLKVECGRKMCEERREAHSISSLGVHEVEGKQVHKTFSLEGSSTIKKNKGKR